nr:MAG TPA: hypothetical protein [Caudoviricetes sp.]
MSKEIPGGLYGLPGISLFVNFQDVDRGRLWRGAVIASVLIIQVCHMIPPRNAPMLPLGALHGCFCLLFGQTIE